MFEKQKKDCQHKILCKASWANKLVIYKMASLHGLIWLELIIKEHAFVDFACNF